MNNRLASNFSIFKCDDKHSIGHAKRKKMWLSQAAYSVGRKTNSKQKIITQYNNIKVRDRFKELWGPKERIHFLKV